MGGPIVANMSTNISIQSVPILVREVMMPDPVFVSSDVSVDTARQHMFEICCRHLPVVEGGKLVGIVTPADFTDTAKLVGEVMSSPVITVCPDARIEVAVNAMTYCKMSCVVVVSDGVLVGIVTTEDLLVVLATILSLSPGNSSQHAVDVR